MALAGARVYIHGRLRGLTKRRIAQLAVAVGVTLTRRPTSATTIVLGHSSAGGTLSDSGDLNLGFQPPAAVGFVSEAHFKQSLGILPPASKQYCSYSVEQLTGQAGLTEVQLRGLEFYDILKPVEGYYSYTDLVAARSISRLLSSGAKLGKIVAAAIVLEERGKSLSSVRLSEAPWGEILQEVDGRLAGLDGQLHLRIEGDDINADEAFARAEASESEGDMPAAQRWYELAARLDRGDAIIPFNLGNVLDALNRRKEAAIAYRQAIGRSPDLADAWFNLGVLQEKEGQDDKALASYERAVLIEPSYTNALHNAGLLLMRLRRFGAALPLWERIVATTPAGASEAKRLAHLCRLEMKHAGSVN
jgi:tetratricopeptide (TPR) repeat protein